MKKETKNSFLIAVGMLVAFVLWTVAVRFVDVKVIGPNNSSVGFATVNLLFHKLTGVNFTLYTITDWLGLVPVFVCFGFGLLGFIQLMKRKHLLKVDYSILVLGGFYIAVIIAYLFFEECVINYRPVLFDGYLEASYPSSTTLLVLCVMPTAIMQFNTRIKNAIIRWCVVILITVFVAFVVIGRLVSGVHWLTDIIGGALLSTGLVMMYHFINSLKTNKGLSH
ncbi:MAG: phosphatase PAP2 family protein [Acutalibacteraceae bacterium]|nr:phosphatase PAP2 family protein [Acutalibacteraceae bacterium]